MRRGRDAVLAVGPPERLLPQNAPVTRHRNRHGRHLAFGHLALNQRANAIERRGGRRHALRGQDRTQEAYRQQQLSHRCYSRNR